ncbi:hypothetical protein J1N35_007548 [Gossypium stocksii]|uniref:Uncharacterized protein n=1 Tax=Gossypium stocksii TaxID=47602 RepID=A0A9D3W8P3_9ROSI|nr:hypothetical protein J1N35_007548 [Gossypium stocksii]
MEPLPPKHILWKSGSRVILLCTVTGGRLRRGLNDSHYVVIDWSITGDLADTPVDVGGLLGGQQLRCWSEGDVPFRVTTVVIIKQLINNYNRYHIDPSLTSIPIEHLLFA